MGPSLLSHFLGEDIDPSLSSRSQVALSFYEKMM